MDANDTMESFGFDNAALFSFFIASLMSSSRNFWLRQLMHTCICTITIIFFPLFFWRPLILSHCLPLFSNVLCTCLIIYDYSLHPVLVISMAKTTVHELPPGAKGFRSTLGGFTPWIVPNNAEQFIGTSPIRFIRGRQPFQLACLPFGLTCFLCVYPGRRTDEACKISPVYLNHVTCGWWPDLSKSKYGQAIDYWNFNSLYVLANTIAHRFETTVFLHLHND